MSQPCTKHCIKYCVLCVRLVLIHLLLSKCSVKYSREIIKIIIIIKLASKVSIKMVQLICQIFTSCGPKSIENRYVSRGKVAGISTNSDDRSTIKLQRSSIFMIQYEFEMKQKPRGKHRVKHNYTHHTWCTVAVYTSSKFVLHHRLHRNSSKAKQNKMCKFATLCRLNMSTLMMCCKLLR